ncbi:CHAT domain-containing protein [Leptolyngbya sp. FACHB-16]|nr:CHAT domain-containing protein [Leptolyngbya sp. FACHB-8]MBD2156462.1 CHAT domain-containing protein [Leptolyngbya sp. FACHB-16]
MTQEFHISVTPVGSDEYLVRTERVAPGVPLAEEQVVWTVDTWLSQARQLMNNPLLELLQGNGTRVGGFEFPRNSGGSGDDLPVPPSLMELGQNLYNSLFKGTLRDSWMTARGIAQHKGEMLRLRLGLKGPKLPRLPWEVLNGGDRDGLGTMRRPIATGTDVIFSRYTPGIGMMGGYLPPLERNQPIRILMAIAAPTDKEQLELKREAMNLQQELAHTRSNGDTLTPNFELTLLEQPGREELTQALEQGQYHILHYAGHSNLGVSGGNLYLVNRRTGLTEVLSGDDLAGLLVNNGIRMVVFNSCRGAHSAIGNYTNGEGDLKDNRAERNLAEALVGRGIPAVLAMAEKIPDDVALTLTRLFYRNLKQGYPLDLSLSRARQGLISAYSSHQFYWALPVLYLHPEWDGYLVPGERDRLNPADRLLLAPHVYDRPPDRSGDSATPPPPPSNLPDPDDELEMISRAVLLEDDLPPAQPTSQPAPATIEPLDDLVYEEANDMADLLKQLTPDADEAPLSDDFDEDLFAPDQEPHQTLYDPLSAEPEAEDAEEAPLLPLMPEARPLSARPLDAAEQMIQDSSSASRLAPRWRSPYLLLPLVGATAMVIGLGVTHVLNRDPSPNDLLPPAAVNSPVPTIDPAKVDLAKATTEDVTLVAMDRFSKGELAAGGAAIAELLNRNAVEPANTALRVLTPEQMGDPEMLFLRGRVAWQAIAQGNTDYSNDDVRRFWETAVEKKPDSAQYRNALGFAYYKEGKLTEAVQSWCQTITLIQDPAAFVEDASVQDMKCPMPDGPVSTNAALSPYAGISLAFQKATTVPEFANTPDLTTRATDLHQLILRSNPKADNPTTLPDGWLWTTEFIQEWQALRGAPTP